MGPLPACDAGPPFLIKSRAAGEDPAPHPARRDPQVSGSVAWSPGHTSPRGPGRQKDGKQTEVPELRQPPRVRVRGQIYHGALRRAANVMKTTVF